MAVKSFSGNDTAFTSACKKAGIPATARQFRKWQAKRGAAAKFRKEAIAKAALDAWNAVPVAG